MKINSFDHPEPILFYDCSVVHPTNELKQRRAYAGAAIKKSSTDSAGAPTETCVDYKLNLRLVVHGKVSLIGSGGGGGEEKKEKEKETETETETETESFSSAKESDVVVTTEECWSVCSQLGGGYRAHAIASDPQHEHLRLVPWAGVAACISRTTTTTSSSSSFLSSLERNKTKENEDLYPTISGQAYCFLPLPVSTSLPIHVNGYFELSSNRRDILHGDDLQGIASSRAQWNESLLEEIAAACMLRLIENEKIRLGISPTNEQLEGYYNLFPTIGANDGDASSRRGNPWMSFVNAFYAGLAGKKLLHCRVRSGVWLVRFLIFLFSFPFFLNPAHINVNETNADLLMFLFLAISHLLFSCLLVSFSSSCCPLPAAAVLCRIQHTLSCSQSLVRKQ